MDEGISSLALLYFFLFLQNIGNRISMDHARLKPKYLLLSMPTLKYSRSTHEHSLNAKSFDIPCGLKPQAILKCTKQKANSIKDTGLSNKLWSVSEELNQTMQAIALEQKRNNTLRNLNEILERSNREAEQREKREIKPMVEKEKKVLDKEDYQIDQIQQKYNEEIARITALREQVNSARTDRVVFSALFKKIERQIKHYETLYREKIVKTQLRGVEKTQKAETDDKADLVQSVDEFQYKEDRLNFNQSRISTAHHDINHKFFMTNPDKLMKSQFMKTSERIDPSVILKGNIQEMQSKVNILVKRARCSSPEQAFDYYSSLNRQNAELMHAIELCQWDIEQVEEEKERIRLQRRNSEVTGLRHMKKLTNMLPSQRKLRSYKHIKTNSGGEVEETSVQIFQNLLQTAEISNADKSIVDMMGQLQQILFGDELAKGERQQHCLEGILQKMDKFQNCERIFSKRQFQGEYLKELTKQRKGLKLRR